MCGEVSGRKLASVQTTSANSTSRFAFDVIAVRLKNILKWLDLKAVLFVFSEDG